MDVASKLNDLDGAKREQHARKNSHPGHDRVEEVFHESAIDGLAAAVQQVVAVAAGHKAPRADRQASGPEEDAVLALVAVQRVAGLREVGAVEHVVAGATFEDVIA